jgi:hypothetical protein
MKWKRKNLKNKDSSQVNSQLFDAIESSLPQANSACFSVVSTSSKKILELSRNAVRIKDTSRTNARANFMIDSSKKRYAEFESENEDNDDCWSCWCR